ncbi:hypothetical protein CKO11_12510 [Rhodobacter sp. TJ_12]|nr:hypothetical protein [Rhodobacter sp. TJ_12]
MERAGRRCPLPVEAAKAKESGAGRVDRLRGLSREGLQARDPCAVTAQGMAVRSGAGGRGCYNLWGSFYFARRVLFWRIF